MLINHTILPKKQTAWHWRIHQYFTKQPFNVVREYISHFSKEGEVVLDPFSGTGVTGIESLTLKRKVVLFDLSPLACFISRETVRSPINLTDLKNSFDKIHREMQDTLNFVNKASKKKIAEYEIKEWYPKKIKLPSNSDFEYVEDLFDKKQLIVYAKLLSRIKKIRNIDIKNQFLLIFSNTLGKANLSFMPSEKDGKQIGGGGASIFGKYRYWKPKRLVVLDVWKNFENRFSYLLKGKDICNKEIGKFYNDENYKIYTDSATYISKYVQAESIDYIYTDPPYGAHIAYIDLATMWHAWLGFKITKEIKDLEIIENGDAKHTREHYLNMLFETAKEMYKVLKEDRYLSLVFQHKDTNLWFQVLDAFRDVGFLPENMIHQPTNTTSMHKKANPLNVFGDQIIVNFIKKKKISNILVHTREDINILYLVIETAKKEIIRKIEASSEEIQKSVLNELFLKNKIHKQFIKNMNLVDILKENFVQNSSTKKWMIKDDEKRDIISSFSPDERIFYVVTSLLKEKEKASFDEIIVKVNIQAANGHIFTEKNVTDLLSEIATSEDGFHYSLKVDWDIPFVSPKETPEGSLFSEVNVEKEYENLSEHNKMIFDLASLGNKLGYKTHIGKTERQKYKLLQEYSNYESIPYESRDIRAYDKNKIDQIDLLWIDDNKDIIFAFEVETSTTIKSGLERFYSLLNARYSAVLAKQRMLIVIPNEVSRINTLKKELGEGTFSGQPFYMERKVKYLFLEDLKRNISSKHIKEIDDLDKMSMDCV